MRKLFIILLLLLPFHSFAQDTVRLGGKWEVRNTASLGYYRALVPGNIYSDLFREGVIPDPFYGENEQKVKWVDTCTWKYATTFDLPEASETQNYELICEGLDTYADVYVNGHLLKSPDGGRFSSSNMFRPAIFQMNGFLKNFDNRLEIIFYPALKTVRETAGKQPLPLPGGDRVYVRKAQYHFGWDWGPALAGCGIWKNIYVREAIKPVVESWYIQTVSLQDGRAECILYIEANGPVPPNEAELILDNTAAWEGRLEADKKNKYIAIKFSMPEARAWWPNGLGTPYLYTATLNVGTKEQYFSERKQVGLRTIELVQQKEADGRSFYFKVNGKPVFIKGANYVPAESFYPVQKDKYAMLVKAAKDANMNMLRVWGGGVYEDEEFYRLCDENGILVWQDFMFACAMYPGTTDFYNDVKKEATYQVRRLRNHPSLALWCGNNENREGWFNWGWQKELKYTKKDSLAVWQNYRKLFEVILPAIVTENQEGISYWPSSPLHGWGRNESLHEGDLHYWGVWWGKEPFEKYEEKIPRFMSEYGFQGMPALQTIEQVTEDRDTSAATLRNHQKHPFGFENIAAYMQRYYGAAKDFGDYIYLSQLTQAYGMQVAIDAHRSHAPYCMGTLFWQLNDCWPAVSWSTVDYYGRWKAAQYKVREKYRNIFWGVQEKDGSRQLFLQSDSLQDVHGRIQVEMYAPDGSRLIDVHYAGNIVLKAGEKYIVHRFTEQELGETTKNERVVWAGFHSADGKLISETVYWPAVPKDTRLQKPVINVQAENGYVVFTTNVPAKDVFWEIEGYDGNLEDNFFDLLPGHAKKIRLPQQLQPGKNIVPLIRVKSLYDVLYAR